MATDPGKRRPDWPEYFLDIASAVAKRGDCTRRQVGAVVVDQDNRIVSTGYNGAATGKPGCLTAGACPRGRPAYDLLMGAIEETSAFLGVEPGSSYDTGAGACIALHAEQNALLYAGQGAAKGCTLYLTDAPCDGCWRFIWAAGITRVVTAESEWLPTR